MDSVDGTDKFDDCIKSIVDKFGADPIPVQFPIGYGKDFHGLVDVIEQKAYFFEPKDKNENYKTEEIPRDLIEKTLIYRKNLIEKVIEHDEEIALSYLEDRKEPTTKEIKKLLRTATLTGRQFPVFCGSAYKYVGVKLILDGVVNYLPSPEDVKEIITFDPDNSENKRVIT
jgi:elongation factor G